MKPASPRSLPLRVLLVDDHAVVRVGVKTILADDPRLCVVGEANTGAECLRLVSAIQPDAVLLDLRLPDQSGDVVCRLLKALPHPPKVIILTSFGDDASVLACHEAGMDGYLLKDFEQTDLAHAVVRIVRDGVVMMPPKPRRPGRNTPAEFRQRLARLTTQEHRVLELLAAGRTNKEISSQIDLTEGTIRNYVSTILAKLEVTNRTEAVVMWLQYRGTGS
jgi:two-component system response regulator DevR